jgi:hypothetical protein
MVMADDRKAPRAFGIQVGYSDDDQFVEITVRLRREDVEAYMGGSPFSPVDVLAALKADGLLELLRASKREGAPRVWDEELLRNEYAEFARRRNRPDYREFARRVMGAETDPEIRAVVQALRRALSGTKLP